jgi:hypothetical protein
VSRVFPQPIEDITSLQTLGISQKDQVVGALKFQVGERIFLDIGAANLNVKVIVFIFLTVMNRAFTTGLSI